MPTQHFWYLFLCFNAQKYTLYTKHAKRRTYLMCYFNIINCLKWKSLHRMETWPVQGHQQSESNHSTFKGTTFLCPDTSDTFEWWLKPVHFWFFKYSFQNCSVILDFAHEVPINNVSAAVMSVFQSEKQINYNGQVIRAGVYINYRDTCQQVNST